ncbi:hypothetical protein [Dysgonomonas capnocytophagoides]|uniref:hypothetical protein n=1 Tax=Dysgonomonas capnocytophagoides TaxID=45254 RepID=UPI003991E08E
MKKLKSFLVLAMAMVYIPCLLSMTSCSNNKKDDNPKTKKKNIVGFYKGNLSGENGYMEFRENGECEIFECEESTYSREYKMAQAKRDSLSHTLAYSDGKPSDIDNLIKEAENSLKQIEESGKHMTESKIVSHSTMKYDTKGDTILLTSIESDATYRFLFTVTNDSLNISLPMDNNPNTISLKKVEKPKELK